MISVWWLLLIPAAMLGTAIFAAGLAYLAAALAVARGLNW